MTTPTFTISRRFDAPPELVWRTWTEPDLIKRWYGPGMETEVHQLDPVSGGLWLHEMKMGEQSMYQRMEYVTVTPPSKLVLLMSNANADWQVIRSSMMPDWPLSVLTTVTFEAEGDGTLLTLDWTPYDASEAENAAFAAAMEQLGQGWGKGMDVIAEIVADLA